MSLKNGWFADRAPGRGRYIFDPAPDVDDEGGGAGGGDRDGRSTIWRPDPSPDGDRSYVYGPLGRGIGGGDGDADSGAPIVLLRGSTMTAPGDYDFAYSDVPIGVAEFNLYNGGTPASSPFTRADFEDFVGGPTSGTGGVFRAAAASGSFYIEDIFLHNPIFDGGSWNSRIVDGLWHSTAPTDFDHWVAVSDLSTLPVTDILSRSIVYRAEEHPFPNAGEWATWNYAANGLAPVAVDNETGVENWDLWGLGGKEVGVDIPQRDRWQWTMLFDFGIRQSAYPDYDFGPVLGDYNDGIANREITVYNNYLTSAEIYTHDSLLNPSNDHVVSAVNQMQLEFYPSNVVFVDNSGYVTVHRPGDLTRAIDPIKIISVSTTWAAHGALFSFDRDGLVL